ncbi:MAG: DUF29 domain-containing protein [Candidatus Entotheonellia bacterium]
MTETSYQKDVYAWTQDQAKALRAKDWQMLDYDHLAEEIESLGNEQRHAIRSHLRSLLLHLLKWQYQREKRSESWRTSIDNARDEIADRVETSPSLRPELASILESVYPRARRKAQRETDLPLPTFPETCPWSLDQLQDDDFFPGSGEVDQR